MAFGFTTAAIFLWLWARKRLMKLTGGDVGRLCIPGGICAMPIMTFAEFLRFMAGGINTTIQFLYPIIVGVIMALFFHERITRQTGKPACLQAQE